MKVSLPVLLFAIFLVLKLTNVIAWSWLWVTAPLWIGLAIVLAGIVGFLVVTLVIGGLAAIGAAFRR